MSKSHHFRSLLTIGVFVLLSSTLAFGQTYSMRSSVVSGGAVDAEGGGYAVKGTIGQPVVGTVSGGDKTVCQGFWCTVQPAGVLSTPLLDLTVFLEGAYISDTDPRMSTNLSAVIPLAQPYNTLPWNYAGSEAVTQPFLDSNTNIVDWVYVEVLYNDGVYNMASEAAGFLLDDGSIVGHDGTDWTGGVLTAYPARNLGDTYWVVVHHRNHISVMTNAAQDVSNLTYDFTTSVDQSYGSQTQADMDDGTGEIAAMYAADANGSVGITAEDYATWLVDNNGSGYLSGDFNLSGGVTAEDYVFWLANNNTSGSIVPSPPP